MQSVAFRKLVQEIIDLHEKGVSMTQDDESDTRGSVLIPELIWERIVACAEIADEEMTGKTV